MSSSFFSLEPDGPRPLSASQQGEARQALGINGTDGKMPASQWPTGIPEPFFTRYVITPANILEDNILVSAEDVGADRQVFVSGVMSDLDPGPNGLLGNLTMYTASTVATLVGVEIFTRAQVLGSADLPGWHYGTETSSFDPLGDEESAAGVGLPLIIKGFGGGVSVEDDFTIYVWGMKLPAVL